MAFSIIISYVMCTKIKRGFIIKGKSNLFFLNQEGKGKVVPVLN
jgi:hypothetical protein